MRLAYRVADRLGMTVARLSREMSLAELRTWGEFYQIERGQDDSWVQSAALRLLILQLFGDRTTRLADLIPRQAGDAPADQKSQLLAFVAAHNAAWIAAHPEDAPKTET